MNFDVLNSHTNIFGRYFLQASAGTGKTFAIENIVPRLLIESENPLLLEEILVVTFTRAATRELKSRIYQTLLKIKQDLNCSEGGPSYLDPFRRGGDLKLYAAKRKLEEALYSFEKAQIFTLHGFCLKILQEFAFQAKFTLQVKDVDDCAQEKKLKVYIKDFLRRGIDPFVLSSSQLRRVIKSQEQEIESFCDEFLSLFKKGTNIYRYPTATQQWSSWNNAIKEIGSIPKAELWHDFSLIAPRLSKSKKRIDQADQLFSWIEKEGCSFEEWNVFLEDKEFFLDQIRFDLAYKKKAVHELGLMHPCLFEKMAALFSPLYQMSTDPKILFLVLALAAKTHYDKARLDLSHFNPDDLVVKLQEALKDKCFCQMVQSKYKAAIIDEFQDTDACQWTIFEMLFLQRTNPLEILYLVGDPKQSIYAFRQADVYLYLKAASLLGEQAIAHLNTNFRSHPCLVEALNELFSYDLPDRFMLLPLTGETLEVRRVQSKPEYSSALDKEEKGRIHFLLVSDEGVGSKKWPSEIIEEERLFPAIAREIIRLKKERGYSLDKIAILVKDRYQAVRLQENLKNFQIPCLMQKNLDVSTSLAYESMKGLLEAVQKPRGLSSLKKFLGGPLMGFSSEKIMGGLENPIIQKTREYFIEAGFFLQVNGFGLFFQNFLKSPSCVEGKNIAQDILSRMDAHLYFEFRQIAQILLENCPNDLYDVEALLEFLEEMKYLPPESEALKQFSEEEEEQVQVMTIHKSKGLEFEIVFALGLCARHSKKEEFIAVRTQEGKETKAVSDQENEFLFYQQEIDAEKMRQLYVALTRGKERVYVPIVFSKNPKDIPNGSAAPIELLFGAIGLSTYLFEEVYQRLSTFTLDLFLLHLNKLQKRAAISWEILIPFTDKQEMALEVKSPFLLPPPPLRNCLGPQFLLSFSSLISGSKEEKLSSYKDKISLENLEPVHRLPLGAETGTVIHAILETLCKTDLHRKGGNESRKIIEDFCRGSCLEGREEDVVQMVHKIMVAPITTTQGILTLGSIPCSDMRLEMEFLYPFQDTFLKGFIDLFFRFQGRYYILDWKTNFLGPTDAEYSLANMEECMNQNGYFLQASIYTEAIRKYIALFEEASFDSIFGGAIYFFVRGITPYFFLPDKGTFSWK